MDKVQNLILIQYNGLSPNIQMYRILYMFLKHELEGRAQWLTPIIPALWEAEVGGSRDQEIKTILVNMVKPRLY